MSPRPEAPLAQPPEWPLEPALRAWKREVRGQLAKLSPGACIGPLLKALAADVARPKARKGRG